MNYQAAKFRITPCIKSNKALNDPLRTAKRETRGNQLQSVLLTGTPTRCRITGNAKGKDTISKNDWIIVGVHRPIAKIPDSRIG